MPDLPQRKVGIIACSGEEMPEGLVTRLAALKVLEHLRPGETVTICLPLFLAGGESDRAFARFYPTIALDGCEKRCAYRATEKYSNRPALGLVASEIAAQEGVAELKGTRYLNGAGQELMSLMAEETARQVDTVFEKTWSRREGVFAEEKPAEEPQEERVATCSCGSGIPIQHIQIDGEDIVVVALPLIYKNFQENGAPADDQTAAKLLEMVKIYNRIAPEQESEYQAALLRYYRSHIMRNA